MTNLITVLILTNLVATGREGKLRERDWQIAANDQYFKGRLEVTCSAGRCDIVTDTLAVEVDWITKEQEGRGQARRYAAALEKEPAVALIIPKESNLTVTNARLRTFLLQRPGG